jgi:TorA maturation chaperone TorD
VNPTEETRVTAPEGEIVPAQASTEGSSEYPPSAPLEEMIGVNRFRETLYHLLSRLFSREVDSESWPKIWQAIDLIDQVGDFSDCPGYDDIALARLELTEFLHAAGERDLPEVLTDMGRMYAGLFLGVGTDTVPLCESVYTGASATLYQDAYFDVRRRLRESGVAKAEHFTEPEDHLAVELAQMAHLSGKLTAHLFDGASTRQDVLAAQRHFLTEHLLNWAPDLAQRIDAAAPGSFYASASRLLVGFLRLDRGLTDFMGGEGTLGECPSTV